MRIDIVSIFPEYLAPLEMSLIGKAAQDGLLNITVHDLRTWTTDKHRTVDDTPVGGGAGMVMLPEPWAQALDQISGQGSGVGESTDELADAPAPADAPVLIVPSPAGQQFSQAIARELAREQHLIFACGRYEGIDERVFDYAASRMRVRKLSLGDYVLNGGEVAAMAMVEATARLIPGVIGNAESLVEESHEDGLLEYPVYTKPANWRGREVPEVLLSGHHAKIARWRRDQRIARTAAVRPDLLAAISDEAWDKADRKFLAELNEQESLGQADGYPPLCRVHGEPSGH